MIIEIIDSEEKIQTFLPVLDEMITGGWSRWKKSARCAIAAPLPKNNQGTGAECRLMNSAASAR